MGMILFMCLYSVMSHAIVCLYFISIELQRSIDNNELSQFHTHMEHLL